VLVNWIRRIRIARRPAALALAALVLLGVLLGGFHHHEAGRADDGCVLCTLAHTSADTPEIVVLAPAMARPIERTWVATIQAPPSPARSAASSRAPPQS